MKFANYDEYIEELTMEYIEFLKDRDFNFDTYNNMFRNDFISRLYFFDNVRSIKAVRMTVRAKQMELVKDELIDIDRVFLKEYNKIAKCAEVSEITEEDLLDMYKNWAHKYDSYAYNRAFWTVYNRQVALLARKLPAVKLAERCFIEDVKWKAADIINDVINNVKNKEILWK